MTLSAIIALLPNSTDFEADYDTVVEDKVRKILSPMQPSTFGENYNAPCSAVSFCDREHLV